MKVQIEGLTNVSRRDVVRWRRRLRKTLRAFRDRIREVSLRLHEPIEPHAHQRCVVLIHLKPSGGLAVRRDGPSFDAAVAAAAERLKALLSFPAVRHAAGAAIPRPAYALME